MRLLLAFLLSTAVHAETFTNRTQDGRFFLTTVTTPRPRMAFQPPPLPPGMAFRAIGLPSKPNPKLARVASIKSVEAVRVEALVGRTDESRKVIVGPFYTGRVAVVARRTIPNTEPPGPPVIIDVRVNQPVVYPSPYPPGYEIISSTVTKVMAVALAGHRCEIQAGGDLVGWVPYAVFGAGTTDRPVELNWIIPTDQDPHAIFFRSVNFPE